MSVQFQFHDSSANQAALEGSAATTMLNEFLNWWAQQLRSLLPGTWRASGEGQGDAVVLALPGWLSQEPAGSIDLIRRRRGRETELGRYPLTEGGMRALATAVGGKTTSTELRLPASMLLDQAVTLPLAAERDPGRVLGYEMDRLTPFRAEDLFWTWQIERRDRVRGQVHLRLYLAPKAPLLPVLQSLDAVRIRPVALRSGVVTIALQTVPVQPWRRRVNLALAAACVLLAIAAAAAPFVRQSRALDRVERRIASLRPMVDQADALRRRAASSSAGADVLAAQRARSGNTLEMLATLTNALPDDTVLTDLTIQSRAIALSGQSAAAARLIGTLAAEPALRNSGFAAPVTRNEASKTEGFSIRTEMVP